MQKNNENIWNSVHITKFVLILINPPNNLCFFDFHIYSILTVQLYLSPLNGVWNWTADSSWVGKACHLAIPADKAHKIEL